jgi:hypothetical protein
MPLLEVSIKKVTELRLDVVYYRNKSLIKVLELSAKLCSLFVIMEKIYMGEDCNSTLILEAMFKLFDFTSLFNSSTPILLIILQNRLTEMLRVS